MKQMQSVLENIFLIQWRRKWKLLIGRIVKKRMKDCYGLCKQCIWYRNGGCSEYNGFEQIIYRRQNHCFHC